MISWYRIPGSSLDLFHDYANFIEKCDYENKQLIIFWRNECDYSEKSPRISYSKIAIYFMFISVRTFLLFIIKRTFIQDVHFSSIEKCCESKAY